MTIKIPVWGTRVRVTTQPGLPWMFAHYPPITGIVSHGNAWDQPNTFRLTGVDNCLGESVINVEKVLDIEILGTSQHPDDPQSARPPQEVEGAVTHEVRGSTGNLYHVVVAGDRASCDCTAGARGRICRHIKEVRARGT